MGNSTWVKKEALIAVQKLNERNNFKRTNQRKNSIMDNMNLNFINPLVIDRIMHYAQQNKYATYYLLLFR